MSQVSLCQSCVSKEQVFLQGFLKLTGISYFLRLEAMLQQGTEHCLELCFP